MKYPKSYTTHDMDLALDCLKEGRLSLTRASEMFKIPATTLWQRANKLGKNLRIGRLLTRESTFFEILEYQKACQTS